MTTPDHIARIIERIDPADQEALERYLSDLIESRNKAEHQAGILGDKLEGMTCKAGDLGDKIEDLKSLRNRAGVELEHALRGEVRDITWCPADRLGRVALPSQKVEKLRQERDEYRDHLAQICSDLVTERDALAAQNEILKFQMEAVKRQRNEEAAQNARLRGELEYFVKRVEEGSIRSRVTHGRFVAMLSETPAISLAEIKAQAIEEATTKCIIENPITGIRSGAARVRDLMGYADRIRKEK